MEEISYGEIKPILSPGVECLSSLAGATYAMFRWQPYRKRKPDAAARLSRGSALQGLAQGCCLGPQQQMADTSVLATHALATE
jgi:hypothetical protein